MVGYRASPLSSISSVAVGEGRRGGWGAGVAVEVFSSAGEGKEVSNVGAAVQAKSTKKVRHKDASAFNLPLVYRLKGGKPHSLATSTSRRIALPRYLLPLGIIERSPVRLLVIPNGFSVAEAEASPLGMDLIGVDPNARSRLEDV